MTLNKMPPRVSRVINRVVELHTQIAVENKKRESSWYSNLYHILFTSLKRFIIICFPNESRLLQRLSKLYIYKKKNNFCFRQKFTYILVMIYISRFWQNCFSTRKIWEMLTFFHLLLCYIYLHMAFWVKTLIKFYLHSW